MTFNEHFGAFSFFKMSRQTFKWLQFRVEISDVMEPAVFVSLFNTCLCALVHHNCGFDSKSLCFLLLWFWQTKIKQSYQQLHTLHDSLHMREVGGGWRRYIWNLLRVSSKLIALMASGVNNDWNTSIQSIPVSWWSICWMELDTTKNPLVLNRLDLCVTIQTKQCTTVPAHTVPMADYLITLIAENTSFGYEVVFFSDLFNYIICILLCITAMIFIWFDLTVNLEVSWH